MFPKAHAAAYVTMAFRIAWFKSSYSKKHIIQHIFQLETDEFDSEHMIYGKRKSKTENEKK